MTADSRDNDASLHWGLALSLLLHLAFSALSQIDSLADLKLHLPEQSMEVELVRETPPPPPPQQAEPQEPPPPRPEPTQLAKPNPIPPPQLQKAKLAEKSLAPKQPPQDSGISFERRAPPPVAAGDLSQSAQDYVLSQVLKMWHFDTSAAKGSDLTIAMTILVDKDGTLVGTMNKNAPWNPQAVIRGYDQLPADSYIRRALESMLLALRLAQPLQLPPDDGKGWPRRMVIRFRPGDL